MAVSKGILGRRILCLPGRKTALGGGDVGTEIPLKADKVHEDDTSQAEDWGVFRQIIEFLNINAEERSVFTGLWWDVVMVLGKIVGVYVMATVG